MVMQLKSKSVKMSSSVVDKIVVGHSRAFYVVFVPLEYIRIIPVTDGMQNRNISTPKTPHHHIDQPGTHARPSLPVNQNPNPALPNLGPVGLHDTAAIFQWNKNDMKSMK